jgi:acetolactate synthase-1/2/3 large subunit
MTTVQRPEVTGTGGQLLAAQLAHLGAQRVFGVPGAQLDWAVDGLTTHAPSIKFVHARHEQGAAYMADGCARATGEPAYLMVVPGPGMLNASAALSTAWACSSPVVAIVAAVPTTAEGRRLGALHEIDGQSEILRRLVKWHRKVASAAQIPSALAEATWHARSGRPRPVAVEIPADLFTATATAQLVPEPPISRTAPDLASLARAAELLAGAIRPVIVAGQGVVAAGAQRSLAKVAELLGAPVVTTTNGRSALDNGHPLALRLFEGSDLVAQADVVLAVGTRFVAQSGQILRHAAETRLIVLNADPDDVWGDRRTEVGIVADADLALASLADELVERGVRVGDDRPDLGDLRARRAAALGAYEPLTGAVRSIQGAVPADTVVVTDLTQVGYMANAIWEVTAPRSFVTSGWQGTLGYGYPTALGAKVGRPDRTVVAIVGDGGFGFCLNEMATARAHGIAVITVCFVDSAFGNVRRAQREKFDGRYLATQLANPDFAALARSFGLAGVDTSLEQLGATVKEFCDRDESVVIAVPIGEAPSPWSLLSDAPLPVG